jgi:hypothetical protein
MTPSVGLSGAGLAKFRSAVTVVSARAGALQLTTTPAAFLHNSKLVRQCLSWVKLDKTQCEHNSSAFGWTASKRLLGELTLSLPSKP